MAMKSIANTNISEQIGRRIRELRKSGGITQDELARRLGKSVKTVQRYESGTVDLPISILAEIADVLEVSLNYLVDCGTMEAGRAKLKHTIYFTGKFVIEADNIGIAYAKANEIAAAVVSDVNCDEMKITVEHPNKSLIKRLERREREISALSQTYADQRGDNK